MNRALKQILPPLLVALAALALFEVRIRHEMVDFGVYRQAAVRAIDAEPLYRPEDGHYQFKYLPAFALAMAPFAELDPDTADAIWFALSVAFIAMILRWSVRLLPERRLTFPQLVGLTFIFMVKFYGHELTLGQANAIFGLLLLLMLGALDMDAPAAAGVFVALALLVKPYGVLFAPWLLVSAGRRALVAFAATTIAVLILPALVYGWTGKLHLLAAWYHTVTSTTGENLIVSDNISFAAMWAKWLGAGRPAAVLAIVSALAVFALAAWTWWRRRDVDAPNYLEIALLMILVPLVSPQGWDYVLLLATPAVVVVIDRWRDVSAAWQIVTGATLAVMGLTIFDLMGRTLYARFMATSLISVCAVGLVAALVNLRRLKLA